MKKERELWVEIMGKKLIDDLGISKDLYKAYKIGYKEGINNKKKLSNKKKLWKHFHPHNRCLA